MPEITKRKVVLDLISNPNIAELLARLEKKTAVTSHQSIVAMALKHLDDALPLSGSPRSSPIKP